MDKEEKQKKGKNSKLFKCLCNWDDSAGRLVGLEVGEGHLGLALRVDGSNDLDIAASGGLGEGELGHGGVLASLGLVASVDGDLDLGLVLGEREFLSALDGDGCSCLGLCEKMLLNKKKNFFFCVRTRKMALPSAPAMLRETGRVSTSVKRVASSMSSSEMRRAASMAAPATAVSSA